jgi:hypothetical protein
VLWLLISLWAALRPSFQHSWQSICSALVVAEYVRCRH